MHPNWGFPLQVLSPRFAYETELCNRNQARLTTIHCETYLCCTRNIRQCRVYGKSHTAEPKPFAGETAIQGLETRTTH